MRSGSTMYPIRQSVSKAYSKKIVGAGQPLHSFLSHLIQSVDYRRIGEDVLAYSECQRQCSSYLLNRLLNPDPGHEFPAQCPGLNRKFANSPWRCPNADGYCPGSPE